MKKRRGFLLYLLVIAMLLTMTSPAVLFAAEVTAEEDTEEYAEEIPEAYDWTIETNELKKWPRGPRVEAEGATVMDLDTGAFLYSKNAEAKMYPASITKIMTMLVALEHISDGELDKKVKASESALTPIDSDSSQIWLSVGEKITVRSALYAIMLASANDAANVIAEYVGGSIDVFVQMMNDKAKELGCVNTHFVNPHGLHNEDHYTCAHDMALIAKAAFQIPLFREITKTVEYKIPKTKYMKEDRWLVNHQKMLYEDGEFSYSDCDGGKTGFTDEAWNTLVTYADRDGKTLVCVELKVNGSWKTFNESAELLNYGFDNFRHEEMEAGILNTTLGELAGVCRFGKAALLNQKEMNQTAIEGSNTVMVTIPNKLKTGKLVRSMTGGNKVAYSYSGWEVGEETIYFNNPAFDVKQLTVSDHTIHEKTDSNRETDTGTLQPTKTPGKQSIEEKVDGYMDNVAFGFLNIWTLFNNWVEQHELLSAGIGMLLILLLIPLLVVAYIRDKNARLIKKEREQDEEERRKIEESIDNKSVQEIEAEIRAELEKEKLIKEKEEQKKREAEAEEKRLKEMEELIDKQKEPQTKTSAETEQPEQKEPEIKEEEQEKHELGSTDQG